MLVSLLLAAVFATVATANHPITLRNNCNFAVRTTLSNFPHNGASYTGPAIPEIPEKSSHKISVPKGWNGRICHSPPKSGCQNDCFGGIAFGKAPCSMTEWTFDSAKIGGRHDYDISNIQGFSIAQRIIPDKGGDPHMRKSKVSVQAGIPSRRHLGHLRWNRSRRSGHKGSLLAPALL
ncbi:Osmotin, thaumatin-like protein [Mycena venus]|uniref:Osmotin, thaumatin-like protein n=1 Tax=Mycena venus TaxID=2733690 RepID=A0A8H6X6D6_9AGAR|nr:Osmotin, thaumatin-like protein [Mycena venus]